MVLDMYFDELVHVVTTTDLDISADTMHKYVVGSAELNAMMRMLEDELDEGAEPMHQLQ